MISHQYKAIFIHIPKCAGTTVEDYFVRFLKCQPYRKSWPYGHLRANSLTKIINLYPNYFTFTFVRNPFSRFVSCFRFGLEAELKKKHLPIYKSFTEFIDLAEEWLSIPLNNNPWAHGEGNMSLLSPLKQTHKGKEYWRPEYWWFIAYVWYHTQRQTDFLLDYNPYHLWGEPRFTDAPCSFIGRQESFTKDFSRVLDILKAPNIPSGIGRAYNRKDTRHYSDYYDKATRRRVEDLYSKDLEALGYEFEQADAVSILIPPLYNLEEAQMNRQQTVRLSALLWIKIFYLRTWAWIRAYAISKKISPKTFLRKSLNKCYSLLTPRLPPH